MKSKEFKKLYLEETQRLILVALKILQGLGSIDETKKDAQDIVQDCWRKILEIKKELIHDFDLLTPYLYKAVVNDSLKHRNKKRKLAYSYNKKEMAVVNYFSEDVYELLLEDDFEKILSLIPDHYTFVWKNALKLETEYSQKEVVKMIEIDYLQNFGKELTLDNYRTLKRRAKQSIIEILSNEAV